MEKRRILIARKEDILTGTASGAWIEITPDTSFLDFARECFELSADESVVVIYYDGLPDCGQEPNLRTVYDVAKLCEEYNPDDVELFLRCRGFMNLHELPMLLNQWGINKQVQ